MIGHRLHLVIRHTENRLEVLLLLGELNVSLEHPAKYIYETDNGSDYGGYPADHCRPSGFCLLEKSLLCSLLSFLLTVKVLQLLGCLLYGTGLGLPFLCTLFQRAEPCKVLAQLLVEFLHSRFVVTHVAGIEAIRLLQRAYLCVEVIDNLLLAQVFVRQHTALNLNRT